MHSPLQLQEYQYLPCRLYLQSRQVPLQTLYLQSHQYHPVYQACRSLRYHQYHLYHLYRQVLQ